MKKEKVKGFICGVIATTLAFALTVGALAAWGGVAFTTVNLTLNGKQVGTKGGTYTLGNGEQAPYSISYTDAKNGDTTYLPVRLISELLNIKVGYDGATETVILGEDPTAIGTVVYDKNDVLIVYKGFGIEQYYGEAAYFYIENNSEHDLSVGSTDESVNGFMVTGLFGQSITAGKKANDFMYFGGFEENGITDVENIEFKINIYDTTSYDTIDNTTTISIKVK